MATLHTDSSYGQSLGRTRTDYGWYPPLLGAAETNPCARSDNPYARSETNLSDRAAILTLLSLDS
jgi:hypothetical protein